MLKFAIQAQRGGLYVSDTEIADGEYTYYLSGAKDALIFDTRAKAEAELDRCNISWNVDALQVVELRT